MWKIELFAIYTSLKSAQMLIYATFALIELDYPQSGGHLAPSRLSCAYQAHLFDLHHPVC